MNNLNLRLRQSVVEDQHETSVEELYLDIKVALEGMSTVYSETSKLNSVVDVLQEVDKHMEGVVETGEYDEQTLMLHANVVNNAKNFFNETPVEQVSVESLTHLGLEITRVSNESKGMLSKAWDTIVQLFKRFIDFLSGLNAKWNPLSKARTKKIDALVKEVKSGDASVKISKEEKVALEQSSKLYEESVQVVNEIADSNKKMLDIPESEDGNDAALDQLIEANTKSVNRLSLLAEQISEATKTLSGEEPVVGISKDDFIAVVETLKDEGKADSANKKVKEVFDKGHKQAKGGKGNQKAVRKSAEITMEATKKMAEIDRARERQHNAINARRRISKKKK